MWDTFFGPEGVRKEPRAFLLPVFVLVYCCSCSCSLFFSFLPKELHFLNGKLYGNTIISATFRYLQGCSASDGKKSVLPRRVQNRRRLQKLYLRDAPGRRCRASRTSFRRPFIRLSLPHARCSSPRHRAAVLSAILVVAGTADTRGGAEVRAGVGRSAPAGRDAETSSARRAAGRNAWRPAGALRAVCQLCARVRRSLRSGESERASLVCASEPPRG